MKNKFEYNSYNFKNFIDKKQPLIILGLSGSGKTTLSKGLGKKYKYDVINEDKVISEKFKWKRLNRHKDFPKRENFNDIMKFIKNFFDEKRIFIYEGNRIVFLIKANIGMFENLPFIILKTTVEQSSMNFVNHHRYKKGSMAFEDALNTRTITNLDLEKDILLIENNLKLNGESNE